MCINVKHPVPEKWTEITEAHDIPMKKRAQGQVPVLFFSVRPENRSTNVAPEIFYFGEFVVILEN